MEPAAAVLFLVRKDRELSRLAKDGDRPNDERLDVVVITEDVSDSKLSQLGPRLTGGLVSRVPTENSGLGLFLLLLLLVGCFGGSFDMLMPSEVSFPDRRLLMDPFLRLLKGGSLSVLPPSENDREWFRPAPSPRIRLMRSMVESRKTKYYSDEIGSVLYMLLICKYLILAHTHDFTPNSEPKLERGGRDFEFFRRISNPAQQSAR